MFYKDFTKSRNKVISPITDAIFSQFIKNTCIRINDLELFYTVGPKIRSSQSIKCPSCIVVPKAIEIIEENLSGARFHYGYVVDIGFAMKGPNDAIILQYILYFEQMIRRAFIRGTEGAVKLLFSDISVHFDTQVRTVNIVPEELIGNDIFVFGSGINIVYHTWETHV